MTRREQLDVVVNLIDQLSGKTGKLRASIKNVGNAVQAQGQKMAAGMQHFADVGAPALVRMHTGVKMWEKENAKYIGAQIARYKKVAKVTKRWGSLSDKTFGAIGRSFTKLGSTLKKVSWNIVMIFLSLLGMMWQMQATSEMILSPLKKLIGFFTNWESSLENIISSLVYMQLAGYDTNSWLAELGLNVEDVMMLGIQFQGAMGAIQLSLAKIAVEVGGVLVPFLHAIAAVFADIATNEEILTFLKRLVGGFGAGLLGVIMNLRDSLPALIDDLGALARILERFLGLETGALSFVLDIILPEDALESIEGMTTSFTEVDSALEPFTGSIDDMSTALGPFAQFIPELNINLGKMADVMAQINDPSSQLGMNLATIAANTTTLAPVISGAMGIFSLLQMPLILLSGVFMLLGGIISGITSAFMTLVTVVAYLAGPEAVVGLVAVMKQLAVRAALVVAGFASVVAAGALLFAIVWEITEYLYETNAVFKKFIDILGSTLVGAFRSARSIMNNFFRDLDSMLGVTKELGEAWDWLADKLVRRSVIPEIQAGIETMANVSRESLGGMKEDIESLGGVGAGGTAIATEININIGTISSDVDINDMVDLIDERLVEKLKRI